MKATEATKRALIIAPDDAPTAWFLNYRMTVLATAAMTGGAYGLVETLAPAGESPPLHVHHAEDESFYLIEGRMTFQCGERRFDAGPGSHVFLPRGIPHTFRVDRAPARFLVIHTPGGREQFFLDGGRPAEEAGLPPRTPPDIETLKSVAARHQIDIVGPPMTS
ncbi:quercetin 2,3-dioxygenase [Bradyrhizobium erythrophlei]|uniref:quercetin 2,3-dioxygenase n=1 Tax=Bradyrhizobium erythrophlei TaxID=1437360 RepID=UPI0035ECADD1